MKRLTIRKNCGEEYSSKGNGADVEGMVNGQSENSEKWAEASHDGREG